MAGGQALSRRQEAAWQDECTLQENKTTDEDALIVAQAACMTDWSKCKEQDGKQSPQRNSVEGGRHASAKSVVAFTSKVRSAEARSSDQLEEVSFWRY